MQQLECLFINGGVLADATSAVLLRHVPARLAASLTGCCPAAGLQARAAQAPVGWLTRPWACRRRRELRGAGGSAAAGSAGGAEHEPGETLSGQSDSYKDPLTENLHNRGP